jgi:ubiquinone/menaquinone biosynthesis C-methylase UbiE
MLDRAAEAADQAGLSWVATRVMDAHDLTLNADGFDAPICRQGLMYLADLDRALAGLRRVRWPMNVTLARQVQAGVVIDTRDMTFDLAETVRRYLKHGQSTIISWR